MSAAISRAQLTCLSAPHSFGAWRADPASTARLYMDSDSLGSLRPETSSDSFQALLSAAFEEQHAEHTPRQAEFVDDARPPAWRPTTRSIKPDYDAIYSNQNDTEHGRDEGAPAGTAGPPVTGQPVSVAGGCISSGCEAGGGSAAASIAASERASSLETPAHGDQGCRRGRGRRRTSAGAETAQQRAHRRFYQRKKARVR